jgi:hypothetical protein
MLPSKDLEESVSMAADTGLPLFDDAYLSPEPKT